MLDALWVFSNEDFVLKVLFLFFKLVVFSWCKGNLGLRVTTFEEVLDSVDVLRLSVELVDKFEALDCRKGIANETRFLWVCESLSDDELREDDDAEGSGEEGGEEDNPREEVSLRGCRKGLFSRALDCFDFFSRLECRSTPLDARGLILRLG